MSFRLAAALLAAAGCSSGSPHGSDGGAGGTSTTTTSTMDACERFELGFCEAFHACGMMQGTPDCVVDAVESCAPVRETAPCVALTSADVFGCLARIGEAHCADLTFEDAYDFPECVEAAACVSW